MSRCCNSPGRRTSPTRAAAPTARPTSEELVTRPPGGRYCEQRRDHRQGMGCRAGPAEQLQPVVQHRVVQRWRTVVDQVVRERPERMGGDPDGYCFIAPIACPQRSPAKPQRKGSQEKLEVPRRSAAGLPGAPSRPVPAHLAPPIAGQGLRGRGAATCGDHPGARELAQRMAQLGVGLAWSADLPCPGPYHPSDPAKRAMEPGERGLRSYGRTLSQNASRRPRPDASRVWRWRRWRLADRPVAT